MAHHAFLITGHPESGVERARLLACESLGVSAVPHPDIMEYTCALLSVEDARELGRLAVNAPVMGDKKAFIISASRIFHEAQNALLKLFEEPPAGTHLYLVVPHAGMLLPTLRSRLVVYAGSAVEHEGARSFVEASPKEREKIVAKIVERAKSDKDTEKQTARADAQALLAGLASIVHKAPRTPETLAFLADAARFAPILATRSAPLKQIFEHILLTFPRVK